MDSSPPVLRVQREDYFRRVENENNKMPLEPQNAKPVSTPHLLNRDSENLDPGRKTLMRPRVSRLPVLVKSHQPPTAFHAAQWEEKLLSGKAKKKKSCTRHTPFSMSRHKSLKTDIVSLQPKSGAHAIQPKNNVSIKTHKTRENTLKSPAVLKSTIAATKEKCRSSGTTSGQPNTLKTENVSHHWRSSSSSSVYLDNKIHLSLKDPMRKQNVPDNLSSHPCDKAEGFQLDHAALLSILHNEGVHVSRQPFATSDSQSCATFPLRVSVVKSHQKATVSQNEGLKTAGSVHATPQNASRKGTYMDTPQRVPITKSLALAVSTHKEAKNMWTCQNSPPSPTMQVAQTLFVDQENGRSPDKGKEEQLPVLQASPIKTPCEDRAKMTTSRSDEEEQKIEQGQKFIQSLQRESVICFSTGKKQCRFEKQESSACQDLSEMADVCEPVCRINLAGRFLHRDQKACVSNTALALLPKKLSPMNDLLLDKEVAFYISHSVSDAPRSFPSQPRCINPVASLLHFLESTTFVPLCLDAPSPCSSPLQEK
ncbi:uncharacterized protein troap isoform X3 [Hippocampus comes]|uniref:uncharacterized protein troap isoform X3 n=1 Tax=Hippocampus comes TaxID=109280 RepID=UPI00094E7134|nr:PREDICTED: uncharacterized protein LOC109522759 isoform X3 [Hippocampus comes]